MWIRLLVNLLKNGGISKISAEVDYWKILKNQVELRWAITLYSRTFCRICLKIWSFLLRAVIFYIMLPRYTNYIYMNPYLSLLALSFDIDVVEWHATMLWSLKRIDDLSRTFQSTLWTYRPLRHHISKIFLHSLPSGLCLRHLFLIQPFSCIQPISN